MLFKERPVPRVNNSLPILSSSSQVVNFIFLGSQKGVCILKCFDLVTYLPSNVIDQAVHARLHAEAVLAWQQLWVPVSVQADGAC